MSLPPLSKPQAPLRAEGDGILLLSKTALPFGALRGRAALGGGGLPAGAALLLAGWPLLGSGGLPAVRAARLATVDATDGRWTLHLPCVRLATEEARLGLAEQGGVGW